MANPAEAEGNREPHKNTALDKYEIAEPASYPAFSIPTVPPSVAPSTIALAEFAERKAPAETPAGPYREAWDDGNESASAAAKTFSLLASREKKPAEAHSVESVREKRAIWIVHGMGQQIPFETVDSLTQGLLRVASPKGVTPRLRTVKLGEQTMQRVELDVDGVEKRDGKPLHRYELHLYEAYWAPETEGVAKLQDVVSFLWDGALRGLLNSFEGFKRAMFGDMETFTIHFRTAAEISLTLLLLSALTIINAVTVAASAAKSKLPMVSAALLIGHWPQLTALASCMTAVAFTFGTVLYLAELSRPDKLPRFVTFAFSFAGWVAFAITAAVILGTAIVMAVTMHTGWAPRWFEYMPETSNLQAFATLLILSCGVLVGASMILRGYLRSSEKALRANGGLLFLFFLAFAIHVVSFAVPLLRLAGYHFHVMLPAHLHWASNPIWVWPFLIALSAKIRTLMIEYVGDVAIYVQPNKLDRFSKVRDEIKKTASAVASAIYLACEPGTHEFLYKDVAAVGHSLGSVIAYDTLNRLMLDDWLGKNHLGIADRTNSLVTFGSPLDKTAFFFTIQGKETLHIRERLAATVQPIIESYRNFRKFRWINVYSRNDVVSGKLIFYDLPDMQTPQEVPPLAVHNLIDPDNSVPLVAHVDYWKNELVWTELMQQIAP
jgi:hypothetical protein